ncbi:LytTR family DNA-binding domain-containing protein [Romboutsia sedimentorum]|uniref:Stage 0 sporulation protein A homolog n=1 Tax=Romboutsia sedimentorum TaxID=1368474 RepID=A0ABT7EFG1_9FIRM|nr:LytTR family DNA-binding domain-containing protein [Romboutsia sedimentorum]MDK2564651.1 LytTR family DNA-binding domain-containing protein [Romboutsia sedimentorum]
MYRVVICEDEDNQREILKDFICKSFKDISDQIEILEFSSGEELLAHQNLDGIDIFFLDIQMDKLTGMDVAKKIRESNDTSEIIFITSLLEYVQEGYKVRAYRYLLKPVKYEDLKENILSCVSDIIKKRENFIIIEHKGITNKIPVSTITYIDIIKRDITIHTTQGAYHTISSLSKIEKELEKYNFFRCHKSYLINVGYIQFISKNSVTVNCEEIPVTKYKMNNLKTKLTNTLGAIIC